MPGLAHIIDPLPLFGVMAGAFGISAIQIGRSAMGSSFSALSRLFRADPDAERDYARASVNAVDRIAELEGLPRTDTLHAGSAFLRESVRRLAGCEHVERFATWAEQNVRDRADRHARVVAFWDAVADAGPAMGMAGTILGLIAMFTNMDDPATVGPGMALALLTTLYGMILANMIAGPIARRLEQLSGREIAWQQELTDRLIAIGRREEAAILHAALPGKPRKSGMREAA